MTLFGFFILVAVTDKMAELFIKSRKYVRKSVTEIYNKRGQFSSYSDIERSTLKLKLEEHFSKLSDLDSKIQTSKFSTDCDEAALEVELDSCEQYKTKVQECISTLQNLPQVQHLQIDNQSHQSFLKSPHVPLPTFNSTEGEDLGKFFIEFEQTLSKFKFPWGQGQGHRSEKTQFFGCFPCWP